MEEMKEVYDKLNQKNQDVMLLLVKGMELAQNSEKQVQAKQSL